jgi:hypothetical protein
MYRLLGIVALMALTAGCFTPQWELKTANGGVISYNPLARKEAAELMVEHCGGRGYEVVATVPYLYSPGSGVDRPQTDKFECRGGH